MEQLTKMAQAKAAARPPMPAPAARPPMPAPAARPPTPAPAAPAAPAEGQPSLPAVDQLKISAKACLEGSETICSLLQKGCAVAQAYGSAAASPDEALLCQSVGTVCPAQLQGMELSGALCLQKSMPLCDAQEQICAAVASYGGEGQRQPCLAAFQELCAMQPRR